MSLALAFDKVPACQSAYRLGFALSRILVKWTHGSQISWALRGGGVGHRGRHSVKPPSGCVYVCLCAHKRRIESIFELVQVLVFELAGVCARACVCFLCNCKTKLEGKIHYIHLEWVGVFPVVPFSTSLSFHIDKWTFVCYSLACFSLPADHCKCREREGEDLKMGFSF